MSPKQGKNTQQAQQTSAQQVAEQQAAQQTEQKAAQEAADKTKQAEGAEGTAVVSGEQAQQGSEQGQGEGSATTGEQQGPATEGDAPKPGTPEFAGAVLTEFDKRQEAGRGNLKSVEQLDEFGKPLVPKTADEQALAGLAELANAPKVDSKAVNLAATLGREVNEPSELIKSIRPILTEYQNVMDPSKPVSNDQIRTQQNALFRLVRGVVRSEEDFFEGMHLLLGAFRAEDMTALKAPFLYRGFDDVLTSLPVATQRFARSIFTLLDVAAGIADPNQVYRQFNLTSGLNHEMLTDHMRQRLVSFFSA